ncbi:histidine decarboxylase [Actinoplanes sichuanensis]|uniref:Pyridoxal-dependent decarboxylase n=1 Tax=Actinoplanes sichuanensis TaxID=512349 RepID=A0ABW4A5Z7_9ACTN|nr:pyridoxal-dependent decarboxylase [Actinoplanes sichuanensis]BEL03051.1 histidine decarboxylase [Actinoplanes sichuanensis]
MDLDDRCYELAFPGATDLTYPHLAELVTGRLLNNVGDPFQPGHGRSHTKDAEVQVVRWLGALFGAGDDVWGYVAGGATEGTLHAVDEAVTAHPDVMVYASAAAHYSIAKAAHLVRAPLVRVATDDDDRMSLDDLRARLRAGSGRAAMIVATVGTTEREAVDDVAGIAGLCDDLGITRRRIHVDAALAGVPRALLPDGTPGFGFRAGATSLVVSGHKFLSTLTPCAVILYPRRPAAQSREQISYIGTADTTISGSRSGHTPLLLAASLLGQGRGGHRRRAQRSRDLAAYTYDALCRIGWPAQRLPDAFTITLAQPDRLPRPWMLGGDERTGRIICMPGVDQAWVAELVSDLEARLRGRIHVPAPRPRRIESSGAGRDRG